jgi:Cu/Ag efflux protein CusF
MMLKLGGATAGVAVVLMLWAGAASAQGKPACDQQGRVATAQKIEGQVVKVDAAQNKVTVKEADGTVHEFQASKDTLQGLKPGDRIEANLREAPKCP